MTRVVYSGSSKKKGARPQEHEILDLKLDVEESVAERVSRLLAQQAGARGIPPIYSPRLRLAKRLASRLGCLPGQKSLQAVTCEVVVIHPSTSPSLCDLLMHSSPQLLQLRSRIRRRESEWRLGIRSDETRRALMRARQERRMNSSSDLPLMLKDES